jgi:hypothetical protein
MIASVLSCQDTEAKGILKMSDRPKNNQSKKRAANVFCGS